VQAAEPRDAFSARPQHQMVGIAEDDIRTGLAHLVGRYIALTVRRVPTGMKAGVRIVPRGMLTSPSARTAVGSEGELKCFCHSGPGTGALASP
jgi:hypothetical protein